MLRRLTIPVAAYSVAAVFAASWGVVTLASMLLVGSRSNGSLQAALHGIRWRTLVGFELGLLAASIVGLTLAWALAALYGLVRRRVPDRPVAAPPPGPFGNLSARSWQARGLIAIYGVPVLILVLARAMASAGPGGPPGPVTGQGAGLHPVSLGPTINTADRESEPTFTADGRTMYFNCNSTDICVSHLTGSWEQGQWTTPELLDAPINTEYEEIEPVINAAGDKLYFTSRRPGGALSGFPFLSPLVAVFKFAHSVGLGGPNRALLGGFGLQEVYVTYLVDGVWSAPVNLNDAPGEPHINTPFTDHCLFFSADGDEAYWTSSRPGGFGKDDIWTSRRAGGEWTEPENLGPKVNGPGNEHAPIPGPDGRSLYVTATLPEGFGDEDIYLTSRGPDGSWGPLVNLGPQVNGPGDDRCPAWTPDLRYFLFDSIREGGFGGRDLWWVEFNNVMGYPSQGDA